MTYTTFTGSHLRAVTDAAAADDDDDNAGHHSTTTRATYRQLKVTVRYVIGADQVTSGKGLPFSLHSKVALPSSFTSLFTGFTTNTGASIFSVTTDTVMHTSQQIITCSVNNDELGLSSGSVTVYKAVHNVLTWLRSPNVFILRRR